MKLKYLLITTAAVLSATAAAGAQEFDAALIMQSTFKIVGPSAVRPGLQTMGTAFVVGRQLDVNDAKTGVQVLVTAAHVLDEIQGDDATVVVPELQSDGSYVRRLVPMMIRDRGQPRYVKHPTADVAAMYSMIRQIRSVIGPHFLATDQTMSKYEISAGDEVLAAGYPLGAEGPYGFAILRSGRISSYPLTPMTTVKTLLLDYNVFSGNSGGPVYVYQRGRYLVRSRAMWNVTMLLGLVAQQMSMPTASGSVERLGVAVIVPAPFIRETVELLPPPKMRDQ